MPTMSDGGAIIDVKAMKICFTQWDFEVHCTIPETPPEPPKFDRQWNSKNKNKNTNFKKHTPMAKPVLPTTEKVVQANAIDTANVDKPPSDMTSTDITTSPVHPAQVAFLRTYERMERRSITAICYSKSLQTFWWTNCQINYHHCAKSTIGYLSSRKRHG